MTGHLRGDARKRTEPARLESDGLREACVCGAPMGSLECSLRAHLRGPHTCASCPDCIHDGNRCCGCYDGACCRDNATPTDDREAQADGDALALAMFRRKYGREPVPESFDQPRLADCRELVAFITPDIAARERAAAENALRDAANAVAQDDSGTDDWYAQWLRDRADQIGGESDG
jgi:hypothetical protein